MLVGTERAGHRNTLRSDTIWDSWWASKWKCRLGFGERDRDGVRVEWGREKKPRYERWQPANVGVRGVCQMCDPHDDFTEVLLLILQYKLLKMYWRWNVSPFSLLFGFTKLALFWVISGRFYVWGVIPNGKILTVWYLRCERFFPARKSSKLTLSARLGHLKCHFGLPTGNSSIYTWPANVAAIF